jgi:hypothetical protein
MKNNKTVKLILDKKKLIINSFIWFLKTWNFPWRIQRHRMSKPPTRAESVTLSVSLRWMLELHVFFLYPFVIFNFIM